METTLPILNSENLIENLDNIGAWSAYGLAVEALENYYKSEYLTAEENDTYIKTEREIEMLEKLNCQNWQDLIVKFHNEVGYTNFNGINEF